MVEKDYAFVDEFAALRGQVRGAGNLEWFDDWLAVLRAEPMATLPASSIAGDLEYYVEVATPSGGKLVYPPTAPALNQTVVVAGSG